MMFSGCDWQEVAEKSVTSLRDLGGLFLVTQGGEGRVNVMTIGWFTTGIVWGRPIAVVLVRPSRYSHELLEENPYFSVNIPTASMQRELDICGKYSGRNTDKLTLCGFTPWSVEGFPVPVIRECQAFLMCEVVQKTKVEPTTFSSTTGGTTVAMVKLVSEIIFAFST